MVLVLNGDDDGSSDASSSSAYSDTGFAAGYLVNAALRAADAKPPLCYVVAEAPPPTELTTRPLRQKKHRRTRVVPAAAGGGGGGGSQRSQASTDMSGREYADILGILSSSESEDAAAADDPPSGADVKPGADGVGPVEVEKDEKEGAPPSAEGSEEDDAENADAAVAAPEAPPPPVPKLALTIPSKRPRKPLPASTPAEAADDEAAAAKPKPKPKPKPNPKAKPKPKAPPKPKAKAAAAKAPPKDAAPAQPPATGDPTPKPSQASGTQQATPAAVGGGTVAVAAAGAAAATADVPLAVGDAVEMRPEAGKKSWRVGKLTAVADADAAGVVMYTVKDSTGAEKTLAAKDVRRKRVAAKKDPAEKRAGGGEGSAPAKPKAKAAKRERQGGTKGAPAAKRGRAQECASTPVKVLLKDKRCVYRDYDTELAAFPTKNELFKLDVSLLVQLAADSAALLECLQRYEAVSRYTEALHVYNDTKDDAERIIGRIAESSGVPIADLHGELKAGIFPAAS